MNIHFPGVEKRLPVFSYMLAAFAVFTVLMLTLSFSRHTELHLPIPSPSSQAVHSETTNVPVAIPAPTPPAEQTQTMTTPESAGNSQAALVPQAIAVPVPAMPE